MNTLTQAELQRFLDKAAVLAAGPELRIGRELRYHPSARRTIVIHKEGKWLTWARYSP